MPTTPSRLPVRALLLGVCALLLAACGVTPPEVAGSAGDEPAVGALSLTQRKLTASDGAPDAWFGRALAVDGDTVLVAAHNDDSVGTDAGAVYVFVRDAGGWRQQAKLLPSAADPDELVDGWFGISLAIRGDTAVVGAFRQDTAGDRAGAAYVFVRSGDAWSEQARLLPADGHPQQFFGRSVAVDGDTVLVGAYGDDYFGAAAGAVYVFERSGASWSERIKLTASDPAAGDSFGVSLALQGDTALVGAFWDDELGDNAGAVYAFGRDASGWSQQAKLTAGDGEARDFFGLSLALDGDTAVVGAYGDDDHGDKAGAAYLFERSPSGWVQRHKFTASDGDVRDYFGEAVALHGGTVLVGAHGADDGGTNAGAAYAFERSASGWTQRHKLTASDAAAGDRFGGAVAIAGDTLLVGADFDDDAGSASGSLYWFADAPRGGATLYLSSTSGGHAGGVAFADEDVLAFDLETGSWSLFFDGSAVGLGGADVNAFHLEPDGSLLLSFRSSEHLPGLGRVDDSDVVRFVPAAPGDYAHGAFEMLLDGSDVGLTSSAEDINALARTPEGNLVVSLNGDFHVPGAGGAYFSGKDEDLIEFHPGRLGPDTRGHWSRYLDGSDVGLASSGEDLYGLWIDPVGGELTLTSKDAFRVPGLTGGQETVFSFAPTTLGSSSSGSFDFVWDGAAHGFAGERIDGLFLAPGGGSAAE